MFAQYLKKYISTELTNVGKTKMKIQNLTSTNFSSSMRTNTGGWKIDTQSSR